MDPKVAGEPTVMKDDRVVFSSLEDLAGTLLQEDPMDHEGVITLPEPPLMRPASKVKEELTARSKSNHAPFRTHELTDARFFVCKEGAWVRTTEKPRNSRNTHNKSARRRLAKGK